MIRFLIAAIFWMLAITMLRGAEQPKAESSRPPDVIITSDEQAEFWRARAKLVEFDAGPAGQQRSKLQTDFNTVVSKLQAKCTENKVLTELPTGKIGCVEPPKSTQNGPTTPPPQDKK